MELTLKNLRLLIKHQLTDQPTTFPEQDKELGVVPIEFDLPDFYSKLLTYSTDFDIKVKANIEYKGETFPIYEISVNKTAQRKVFVLSGTHGNEHAGMLVILDLLEDIKQNPAFYSHVCLKILTPHNPVGAKYFSRFNGNGIDINRDFKKRRCLETQVAVNSLVEFSPHYVLSLHEGPHDGTFIYCNKLVSKKLAFGVLEYAQKNGVKLAEKNYFTTKLKQPGYFPITGITYFLTKLTSDLLNLQPEGYFARLHNLPNITVETSWKNPNNDERINGQLQIIKGVISNLSVK